MFARKTSRDFLLVIMLSLFNARISAAASEANNASNPSPARSTNNRDQGAGAVKIIIKVAGKELQATLADNPTAREFASLLPVHVSMDDLFGREKAGPLPRAISTDGARSDVYKIGDIGYWSPSHDVAIYYRQDGDRIPSPGIINIGHIVSGIEAFNVPGAIDITIEAAR
jgi:hypothetical protein